MSEVRPIDANKAVSELRTLPEQERLEYMGVYDLLKSMPTLDYEPVVHAHWETDNSFYSEVKKAHFCSKCEYIAYQDVDDELHKRCPNCGAKMDEEEN